MKSENRLKSRFLLIIMLTVAVMFVAIYLFSVPLIQKKVFEIERDSARIALNSAFQLADKMYLGLEGYRQQALEAHKQRLKAVVELVEHQIRYEFKRANDNDEGRKETEYKIFELIRNFRYGSDGYVWIANYQNKLLSHPDPDIHGRTLNSDYKESAGKIIRRILDQSTEQGEGFFRYKWKKLNGIRRAEKISYVKDFPEWGFVIGSGLYLDELDEQVQIRKANVISELRAALSKIKIAKTGYLYVFDKEGNMLVHPNPNIDRTNASDLIDPKSGRPILSELMSVADTGKELYYKWDSPADPNNYIYDKLALVRLLEGFGWYIGSSVYLDELKTSSEELSQRILIIALISVTIALGAAIFFINHIFRPIKKLVHTAEKINKGDLFARSRIKSDDEIGLLAEAFDKMINHLQENIENLDVKVKESTQELASLEERQRLILDALPAQVAYFDKDLRYVFVNKGYADMFAMRKEDVIGKKLSEVIGQEMMEDISEKIEACFDGKSAVYEYRFKKREKEIITKRTLLPDFTCTGEMAGILNLSLDITAEKEAEKRLTEAHRISVAGQMAGGLAHDFNNLLSIILGNLQVIKERYDPDGNLEKYLVPAIRASLKGADITERLLTFSRHQSLNPKIINPNNVVEGAIALVKNSIPTNIKVDYQLHSNACIFIDLGQMENALVNLVLNAVDAMPNGGDITFRTEDICVDEIVFYDEKVPAGQYVSISIEDGGHGFSKDALAKACEPFFTTKSQGKGTGLGLSMVYGFIKQSKGFLSINNTKAQGAAITLLLPARDDIVLSDEPSPTVVPQSASSVGKLFLLVEDETDVRTIIREQLVSIGHNVIEAKDADEAEKLIANLAHLDVLITDINMPGNLNGFELAELMQERFANSTIVLITGYAYNQERPDKHNNWCMLRKPFDKEALIQAIQASNTTSLT